jgi:hypothetical protein
MLPCAYKNGLACLWGDMGDKCIRSNDLRELCIACLVYRPFDEQKGIQWKSNAKCRRGKKTLAWPDSVSFPSLGFGKQGSVVSPAKHVPNTGRGSRQVPNRIGQKARFLGEELFRPIARSKYTFIYPGPVPTLGLECPRITISANAGRPSKSRMGFFP